MTNNFFPMVCVNVLFFNTGRVFQVSIVLYTGNIATALPFKCRFNR